jgi:hypothetical protein
MRVVKVSICASIRSNARRSQRHKECGRQCATSTGCFALSSAANSLRRGSRATLQRHSPPAPSRTRWSTIVSSKIT